MISPAFPSVLRRRLLSPRLRRIRLVVCDVDGVLTYGGLHYDEDGKVVKRFDVRDGLAVRMLQQAGITLALLSGGRGGASEQRALHLDIHHCPVGVSNKRAGLEELQQELAMGREQTAFLGDDLNDLPVRAATGLLITPADAAPGLRRQADWILRRRGGDGALREFSDALLASQGWMEGFENLGWAPPTESPGRPGTPPARQASASLRPLLQPVAPAPALPFAQGRGSQLGAGQPALRPLAGRQRGGEGY